MAFTFGFESILRLRRSQERQQELLVQKSNEYINHLLRELDFIAAEFAQVSASVRSASGAQASELHFDHARCQMLEERRMKTQQQLLEARRLHSTLTTELQKLWRQREILETLRRREYHAYLIEQTRREQKLLDDLFLARQRVSHSMPN